MGFTVQSVLILGRWVPNELREKVEQLIGLGQQYDPARISSALELVRDEVVNNENVFVMRLIGSTSVLYIDSEVCDVSDSNHSRRASVLIRAYYLRIDLYNLGRNYLPVPRSARPSFFREVPSVLLATAPVFGITNDRQYGTSVMIQTTTDLLQAPSIKRNNSARSIRLNAGLDFRKSLTNPFHSMGLNVDLLHPVYADTLVGWSLGGRYEHNQLPLVKGEYKRQLFRIYGSIQGSFKTRIPIKYTFGGGGRFIKNRYNVNANTTLKNADNGYEIYALFDGRILNGFTRIGSWFEAGYPLDNDVLKSYQRLAGRVGYGTVLGQGHKNVDVEVNLGAGHTWGSPHPYAQFFAGNSNSKFLYEPFISFRNQVFPEGPVIRSLGERDRGLDLPGIFNGGSTYWHLNLNFSIPITAWSRPLIPDVVISEEPRVLTMRSALKGQVRSAKNFIIDDLINNHNYPDNEQTESVVDRIVDKDIRPPLEYLADRANIYSIKPLLLFDVGQLRDRVLKSKMWTAAGVGLQVNVVVARLEMAYMHTLSPSNDSGIGNFFVRFTLQNFY